MAGPNTLEFTEDNFEAEVLKAEVPVMVDFWAAWCMPCRMVGPVLDELATEYLGKAKVGKCDVDQAQNLAAKFNVRNIPTVLLFKDGEPIGNLVGARQKKDYQAAPDQALGESANT